MENSVTTARLRLRSGHQTHLLAGEMLIGRSDACDLRLTDEHGVSRSHARISIEDDGIYISDLGSTNGTRLNGERIKGKVRLNSEDRLRFDLQEYVVEIPSEQLDEEVELCGDSKGDRDDESSGGQALLQGALFRLWPALRSTGNGPQPHTC